MSDEKSLGQLLIDYALSQGAKQVNKIPGLWDNKIDEHWRIQFNPHHDVLGNVPPFSWYVEYNGFPAGILDIRGDGIICCGEFANENGLMEAIERKMQKKG